MQYRIFGTSSFIVDASSITTNPNSGPATTRVFRIGQQTFALEQKRKIAQEAILKLEDQVYWYKADDHKDPFHVCCQEAWDFSNQNYNDGDEDDDNKSPIRGEKIEILNQSTNDATLFNPELLKMIDISFLFLFISLG